MASIIITHKLMKYGVSLLSYSTQMEDKVVCAQTLTTMCICVNFHIHIYCLGISKHIGSYIFACIWRYDVINNVKATYCTLMPCPFPTHQGSWKALNESPPPSLSLKSENHLASLLVKHHRSDYWIDVQTLCWLWVLSDAYTLHVAFV